MPSQVYDVVVVGGGAVGLGAAYETAKVGKSTLVLEQNCLFNASGSSNDLARMYRTIACFEVNEHLERARNGLRNIPAGTKCDSGTLMGPIANLENLGMPFRKSMCLTCQTILLCLPLLVTKEDMEKEYPFKNLPEAWEGIFAPDNGVINVPLLVRTLARLAKDYGAHTQQYTEVKKLIPVKENGEDTWKVEARVKGLEAVSFRARRVIIAAGAYTNHVVQPSFNFKLKLNIWEMFANDKHGRSRLFYGFPTVEWGPPNVCRIAVDAATRQITDPHQRCGSVVNPEDIHDTQQFIAEHLKLITRSDNMFILDYIPEKYLQGGAKDSVAVFTAGWAMKFVPLIGRALKDMVLRGHSEYALDEFKIDRLDTKCTGKDGKPQAGIIDELDSDNLGSWEYLR
nr:putative bifunctional amine oxidase [Quercus suber]